MRCKSRGNHHKKGQVGKIRRRFTQTKQYHSKKKSKDAKYGGVDIKNIQKIADGPADEIWISKLDPDYAYG